MWGDEIDSEGKKVTVPRRKFVADLHLGISPLKKIVADFHIEYSLHICNQTSTSCHHLQSVIHVEGVSGKWANF